MNQCYKELKEVQEDSAAASKQVEAVISSVQKLTEVRAAMKIATAMFKSEWPEFIEAGKKSLEETRLWKMAQIREMRDAIEKMKELQRIVHSAEFVSTASNLKEFVETLERFQKINDTGLIDKVLLVMGYERKQ